MVDRSILWYYCLGTVTLDKMNIKEKLSVDYREAYDVACSAAVDAKDAANDAYSAAFDAALLSRDADISVSLTRYARKKALKLLEDFDNKD